MKTVILSLILCLLLFSCDLLTKEETKNFIPGMYTRHYKDEYTDSYDTIIIKSISDKDYMVTKKSSYQKLNDEKIWVPGYEVKKWMGTLDKGTASLFLPTPGKTIFFNGKNKELRIGTEPYKKIKK